MTISQTYEQTPQIDRRGAAGQCRCAPGIQAEPARKLKNLAGIPILWMQGENNYSGPAQVQFLRQSGCDTDFIRLRDRGIEGNTNLMLLERNNFEVFGVIREWLDRRTKA